jgi:hypothetical protein
LRQADTLLEGAAEAESVSLFAHGGDAEGDVFVERDAEFLGAFYYVFAADAAGEGFVFHSFLDRAGFEIEDAFGGTDVSAGGEKAGEFVAGEKRVLESSLAGNTGVFRMGENGADEFFVVAVLAKYFGAFGGMLTVGCVVVVGPALVIEVVEESGEAPVVFVRTIFAGVGPDAGFDGKHVFAEAFRLGVFAQKLPGIFAGRHWFSPLRLDMGI